MCSFNDHHNQGEEFNTAPTGDYVRSTVKFSVWCAYYLFFSQLNICVSDCETVINNNKEIINRNTPETLSSDYASRTFL